MFDLFVGAVAVALLVYLFVTLIRAERF